MKWRGESGVLASDVARGKNPKTFNSFHFLSSPLRLLRLECAGTQRNGATLPLTRISDQAFMQRAAAIAGPQHNARTS